MNRFFLTKIGVLCIVEHIGLTTMLVLLLVTRAQKDDVFERGYKGYEPGGSCKKPEHGY